MNKEEWKNIINSNISKSGFHITVVSGKQVPRFAYTIGITEKFNFELVFGGGILYLKDDLVKIFHRIVEKVNSTNGGFFETIDLKELGTFSLVPVDDSWSKLLMLGVYDIYNIDKINAFQIIPDEAHFTLDVPDMTKTFSHSNTPVWKYLNSDWDLEIPESSQATTDLDFLKGKPITEIIRWEEDFWEMFHSDGREIPKEQRRVVGISTMLAIDHKILEALKLPLKKGLYRDKNETEWTFWNVNTD